MNLDDKAARDRKISVGAGIAALAGGALWLLSSVLGGLFKGEPKAEVVSVRVAPWTTPQGVRTSMIYVEVRNTGKRPVRVVKANLSGYDAKGRPVYDALGMTVYAAANELPGLQPGQTYTTPEGEGHVVLGTTIAPIARAQAGTSQVLEESSL